MVSNGPVEPSADLRVMANMVRQWYVALTLEDFTDAQALTIVGQMLAVAAANPPPPETT